ncbi:hypothetical protein FKR81_01795 [Lentzea tibetensis]|uniref:Photosynthesis system II assembly factor Ycf48/Hcf136-like domain-containing protein n=1 Tax=Lentzea tibetensis TaxID=2591470 RepID=A0A563F2W2_9PSEU|nr:hypothetical protein [Lentzea tibetensis]TWP54316.1 hypothetical protein FKR81_01795 [Lentzea tibetensis]
MKGAAVALAALLTMGVAGPALADPVTTFQVSSTSWTTKSRGWALGVDGKYSVLMRTVDGGASWKRTNTPAITPPTGDSRLRVHFANEIAGVITDGSRLFVTRTGGTTWNEVFLPTPTRVSFGAIASDTNSFLVLVSSPASTHLYRAPLAGSGAWSPVPGVVMTGAADGDIATSGWRSYVVLSRVHEETRYWVNGRLGWQEAKPPCDVSSTTKLGAADTLAFALCSWNPGMGYMFKELRAAKEGGEFTTVSQGPNEGITVDFAAASPSTVVVSAVGIGAGWLHRAVDGKWTTPFVQEGPPLFDLAFTDPFNGHVVRGGPQSEVAELYGTSDGGATWILIRV